MNPAVKPLWLEALRSGEYEQGVGVLRSGDDRFCCLGVLCDLAVKAGVIEAPELLIDSSSRYGRYAYGVEGITGSLPHDVAEWAGVTPLGTPLGERPATVMTLIDVNDRGDDFETIADIIEAEF